jgi:hypothetical protein
MWELCRFRSSFPVTVHNVVVALAGDHVKVETMVQVKGQVMVWGFVGRTVQSKYDKKIGTETGRGIGIGIETVRSYERAIDELIEAHDLRKSHVS